MSRNPAVKRYALASLGCVALLAATTGAQSPNPAPTGEPRFDAGTISGLPARNIGSAMMSGRIAAVTAVNDNGRLTVIVGSASGGGWKSVDSGTTFRPVFGQQAVQSSGAG